MNTIMTTTRTLERKEKIVLTAKDIRRRNLSATYIKKKKKKK